MAIEIDGLGIIIIVAIICGTLYGIFGTSKYDERDMINAHKDGIVIGLDENSGTYDLDSATIAFELQLKNE